ncbi:ssDNA endonuclease and repair protein rad10 [Quaeritorhiza haematococci]|nr:ssDNA endonuclease and repair protein rad10 [Quaeritorhiza haematococci]
MPDQPSGSSPAASRKFPFRIPSAAEVEQRKKDLLNSASALPNFFKSNQEGTSSSSSSTSTANSNAVPPPPPGSSSSSSSTATKPTPSTSTASVNGSSIQKETIPRSVPTTTSSRAPSLTTTPAVGSSLGASTSSTATGPKPVGSGSGSGSGANKAAAGGARPTFSYARRSAHGIIVNACQRGNGVLNYIKNVPWEYGEIVADYQVGATSCALFLSLKYHRLHPEYIYGRIKELAHHYVLRVILCLVDIDDHQASIRELTKTAVINNFTLVMAWSQEEAGKYLETFKAFENKPPDMIMERVDNDYLSKLTDCLTAVKSINKTDVVTLASTFGSLKNIISAKTEELVLCPGFGEQKVRRLYDALHEPFVLSKRQQMDTSVPAASSSSGGDDAAGKRRKT